MPRPKKATFPVSLETVLRVTLPRKRPEDRMKIFREWARSNLRVKLWREPSDDEFHADFELWCRKPFTNLMHIDMAASQLKAFAPLFSAQNRKKRAQVAAAKTWSKENREKRAKSKNPS
jgi:hypothetical protein